MVMVRIYEEKILKMITSQGEYIEEDYKMKGRVLLMVMMRIYEEKILKMIRSNGEFIEEDNRRKGRGLVDKDEDQ